ncbi:Vanillin dehydrogenase [Fusarium oxysporum f. sp. albedinis]|nr:Vanillin dehydrogenase [Fusarium oxysporum f. sp. albedinis]
MQVCIRPSIWRYVDHNDGTESLGVIQGCVCAFDVVLVGRHFRDHPWTRSIINGDATSQDCQDGRHWLGPKKWQTPHAYALVLSVRAYVAVFTRAA